MREIKAEIREWAKNNKKLKFWLGAMITVGTIAGTGNLFLAIGALIIYEVIVS